MNTIQAVPARLTVAADHNCVINGIFCPKTSTLTVRADTELANNGGSLSSLHVRDFRTAVEYIAYQDGLTALEKGSTEFDVSEVSDPVGAERLINRICGSAIEAGLRRKPPTQLKFVLGQVWSL